MDAIIHSVNSALSPSQLVQFVSVDLLLRGGALVLLSTVVIACFRQRSASLRSVLWLMLISALAMMPFFSRLLPQIMVPLTFTGQWPALEGYLQIPTTLAGLLLAVGTTGYVLVVALLFLRLLLSLRQLLAMTRRASPASDPRLQSLLRRLKSSNGINAHVDVLESNEVVSPMTWGVIGHKILLPADSKAWAEDLLTQSLSHELSHIQRMDWLGQMLSRLVLCVYWLNPLVWYAHGKYLEASEKACDEAVIDDTHCPLSYAENLLWLATTMGRQQRSAAIALFRDRTLLHRRIAHILQNQAQHQSNGRSSLIAGLLFSAVLVMPASAMHFSLAPAQAPAQLFSPIQVSYFPRDSGEHSRLLAEFRQSAN